MTFILGIAHKGKVYMGGDSAGTDSWLNQQIRADQKVFINGPCIMGFTSSFRMGQLLRYSLSVPKPQEGDDDYYFMTTKFVDAVRHCLKTGGFAKKDSEVESGGTFLVGYRGQLYCIESDYQVGTTREGFMAVGCGEQIALGAASVLTSKHPKDRILMALKAAEKFSAGVRGPFVVLEHS